MIPPQLAAQVAIVALGPFQYGIHMTELNAPIPYMNCTAKSVGDCIQGFGDGSRASSIFAIGGLIGSLVAGPSADKLGRKVLMRYLSALYFLGSVISAMSHQNSSLTFGRFISGLAAGSSIVVAPMFITEISPDEFKDLLGVSTQISVNSGILLAQLFGVFWAEDSWRRILWLGPVFALLQLLALSFSVESPRWLLANGKVPEAHTASEQLGVSFQDIRNDQQDQQLEQQVQVSISQYFKDPHYRYSLYIATGIMALQQFSGINAIIFYGVSILKKAVDSNAAVINFFLSLLNLAFTILSARFIDRFGRRVMLCTSLGGMAVGTALLGFGLIVEMKLLSVLAAAAVIVTFAMGMGPIPFMLIGEYTPAEALGVAQSVGTTCNWIATFFIGAFFPTVEKAIGPAVWTIFSLVCVFGCYILGRVLNH